jgi:hypothetical protein
MKQTPGDCEGEQRSEGRTTTSARDAFIPYSQGPKPTIFDPWFIFPPRRWASLPTTCAGVETRYSEATGWDHPTQHGAYRYLEKLVLVDDALKAQDMHHPVHHTWHGKQTTCSVV